MPRGESFNGATLTIPMPETDPVGEGDRIMQQLKDFSKELFPSSRQYVSSLVRREKSQQKKEFEQICKRAGLTKKQMRKTIKKTIKDSFKKLSN